MTVTCNGVLDPIQIGRDSCKDRCVARICACVCGPRSNAHLHPFTGRKGTLDWSTRIATANADLRLEIAETELLIRDWPADAFPSLGTLLIIQQWLLDFLKNICDHLTLLTLSPACSDTIPAGPNFESSRRQANWLDVRL